MRDADRPSIQRRVSYRLYQPSNLSASSGSERARIWAASTAALAAPLTATGGDARGHLDGGEQGVEATWARGNGYPDNGQVGACRHGPGQVGCHACGADYYLQARSRAVPAYSETPSGLVRRADLEFVLDAVSFQAGLAFSRTGRSDSLPTRIPTLGLKVLQLYRLQGYIRTVVHAFEVDLLDRGVGAGPRLDDGRPCPTTLRTLPPAV